MSLDRMRRDVKSLQQSVKPPAPKHYSNQIWLPDNRRGPKIVAPGETETNGAITIYGAAERLEEYLYAHKKDVPL